MVINKKYRTCGFAFPPQSFDRPIIYKTIFGIFFFVYTIENTWSYCGCRKFVYFFLLKCFSFLFVGFLFLKVPHKGYCTLYLLHAITVIDYYYNTQVKILKYVYFILYIIQIRSFVHTEFMVDFHWCVNLRLQV